MTATFFPRRVLAALVIAILAVGLSASPASAVRPPLNVLTYNIHHGAGVDGVLDLERIAQVIESSGADVLGLQEVDRNWSARSNWVDQPAWLAARLGMHYAYAANLDLDPVHPGEPRRQYGTAVLSRFKITESHNTLLPVYPGQEQRGLLEATVKVRGTEVTIANTHLTHNNNAERQEQSSRVVELVGHSRRPVVLIGDLNATAEAPEIKTLTAVLADTWASVGSGPGYTYEAALPTKRIDFVLHNRGVRARSAEVLSTLASDHLPVLTTLDICH